MRVYDLKDDRGRVISFEVENLFLSRNRTGRIIRRIPNVNVTKGPQLFSFSEADEFCEFEIQGEKFVACEPFGDNSRYWIGTQSGKWCEQIEIVRNAFIQSKRLSFA